MSTKRKEVSLDMTGLQVVTTMAEGNPGAMRVLMQLLSFDERGLLLLLHLDDMNIRGTQVWVAFKDWAHEDMPVFVKAIVARDPAMVEAVNAEGRTGNHVAIAVTGGASNGDRREIVA